MSNFTTKLDLAAKGGTSDFEVAAEGVHKALCTKVIHLGTIPGSEMYPAPKNKVRLEFELEQGGFVGTEYTLSLGKKSRLLKDLQTWTEEVIDAEKGYNIFERYGKTCKLQLDQKTSAAGNVYNRVVSILKSDHTQTPAGECIAYSVAHHDQSLFEQLPEFIQNSIRSSEEWENVNPAPKATGELTAKQVDEAANKSASDIDKLFN
jgi:hypothetical protein